MHTETQSPASSVEALLRAGVRLLDETSGSPRLDAEILLAHVLDCSRTQLFVRRTEPVQAPAAARYLDLVDTRRAGKPVAQLTGRREFWSLELAVTPDVLTPRPETELLVERALALIPAGSAWRILDLGTGSGAIALAIASERPDCRILATDRSGAALAVARRNAATLACHNVAFAAGAWFEAASGALHDLVVSNPPYIADHEWATTDPELAFEPRCALAAGADGLDHLRAIASGAPAHLVPGGWLLVEHGAGQSDAVRALFSQAGLVSVGTRSDLAGQPRVTEGRRTP